MCIVSKEMLKMLYGNVAERIDDETSVFWCKDSKNDLYTLYFCLESSEKIVEFTDVIKYRTHKNTGVVQQKDTVTIMNLDTLDNKVVYNDAKAAVEVYDRAIIIVTGSNVIVYSFVENKETFNQECCTTGTNRTSIAKGRVYDAHCIGNICLLVKRDGTVGKLLTCSNQLMHACTNKNYYSDIVIECNSSVMYSSENYPEAFVCNNKIFSFDEFMRYLGITTMNRIEETNEYGTHLLGYDIVTKNGNTGRMSKSFSNLKLNGKYKHLGNILTSDYEYTRKEFPNL